MPTADCVIQTALQQLGKPYLWGAEGPDRFDCSGLVWYSYTHCGYQGMPRTTYTLLASRNGIKVIGNPLPGDLIFPDPGHVGIYIGNGQVIEAPHTGDVVKIVPLWSRWVGRRFITPGAPIAQQASLNIGVLSGLSVPLDIVKELAKGALLLGSGHFWIRALWVALGSVLILVGLTHFLTPAAKTAAKIGGQLA